MLDILWSDPTEHDGINGIHPNYYRDPQGLGGIVNFGPDRVKSFLKKKKITPRAFRKMSSAPLSEI